MISFLADAQEQFDPVALSGDYGALLGKMLLSLLILVVLMVGSFLLLRRLMQGRLQRGMAERSIQILEKRMISPKSVLYLIEVDGKKVLLAESHLEVRRLSFWDKNAIPTESAHLETEQKSPTHH
jgi:flagellar protein FliO/FliZ